MIPRILLGFFLLASSLQAVNEADLTLQLVQIVWRHGDRNPTDPYPGDPYDQAFWEKRGGYGELTTRGMAMHVRLGDALKTRYKDFLSQRYNAHEIYIRSTDVNRTIISAMSNLIGMYSQDNSTVPGEDYPDFSNEKYYWPTGFRPIAIHTVDDNTDYLGNANAYCPRQDALWKLAYDNCPEVKALINEPGTQQLIETLRQAVNITYKVDDLWMIHDVLFIENVNKLEMPKWWSQQLMDNLTKINNRLEDMQDGIGLSPFNGIDFSVELPKLRVGALTNDMRMHMNLKLACQGQTTRNCTWMNRLKYFAYSAHDETIASFLATMGIKDDVVPDGYPLYSSAAMVELYQDKTGKPYFRLMYHQGDQLEPPFETITKYVKGCGGGDFCDVDVFRKQADLYNPGDAAKLCQNLSFLQGSTAQPPQPTTTKTSSGFSFGILTLLAFLHAQLLR
ncbi:unnamed protein product, partial [Mesorhabditis spiculigera]